MRKINQKYVRSEKNSRSNEDRKIRERSFHDEIFATESRRRLWSFYKISSSIRKAHADLLSEYSSKNILEIGCGLGSYATLMASKGAKVSAIDISDYAIKTSKEKAAEENLKIDFRVMDAERLNYGDCEFDLVYGISVLHHLNLGKIVPEIKRVLRTGCKGIFIEPMSHNPFIRIFRILTPGLRSKDEHPLQVRDLQMLRRSFSFCEFRHYYMLAILALPFNKLPLFSQFMQSLERLDAMLFAVFPWMKRFSWQVLLILKK